jgi:hypothetical protein
MMADEASAAFRECMQAALADRYAVEIDGKKKKLTGTELLVTRVFDAASKGDWTAWKLVYEVSGQKAAAETAADVDPDLVAEVERLVYGEQEKKQG